MNGLWVVTMLGLGTVFLVLLFKSHAGFIHSFNQFAGSITGEPDTYHGDHRNAHKEGIDPIPGLQHEQHLADLGGDLPASRFTAGSRSTSPARCGGRGTPPR